ncbi:hypothetical protein BC941DRAFT_237675 [Chlamydoabsidia padenii]|nr:hypothetical protein BC941DRAFT_237675 [Chlamydoabsidia padenii]
MDSSNVPPVGSRPIKTPKRRLNKGSSTGSFDSSSFGAPSQPAFGTAPSSPGGSVQPFGQQQQQQQMFSGFNPSSMTSNSPQSPSFQQQQQPTMGGFGNVQAPPAPPVFTFGTSTPTSIPQTPPASSGFAFGNQNQNTGFNSGFQQQSSAGGFNATPSNTFSFGAPSAPQQQQQSTINSNPFGTQTPTSGSNHQFTTTDSSMDSSDDQTKPATGFSFGTQAPTTTTSSSSFASPTFKGQSSFTMNFGDQSKPTTSGFSFGSGANSTGAGNTLTSGQQSTDTQQNQSFGGFGAQSKTTSSTPAPAFSFGNPQATATSSQVQKDSNQTPSSPFSFGGNIFGTGATVSGNTGFGSTPKEGEKKDENKSSVSSPSSFGSTIVPQGQKDSNQTPSSPFSFSGSASGAGAGVSGNTGFGSTPTKEGEKKEENKPSVSSPFSFGSTTGTKNTGDQPTSNSPFGSTKDNSGDVDKSNDQESASKTSALSFSFGSTTGKKGTK